MKHYDFYLLALLILITAIFIRYQHQQILTSKKFLTTTYSYIILAILITWLTLKVLEQHHVFPSDWHILISFIIMIVCIFAFAVAKSTFSSHLVWLIFLLAAAVLIYPTFLLGHAHGGNTHSIIMILCLVLIVAFITTQNLIDTTHWGNKLLGALWGLIFLQIFVAYYGNRRWTRATLYLGIILFAVLLLYDSQRLSSHSKSLVRTCNYQNSCDLINYPYESLSIFLDLINLYVRTTQH